jgi:hypothetical protein
MFPVARRINLNEIVTPINPSQGEENAGIAA